MARILITGGGGFLGSHLLEEFQGSEHEFLILSRTEQNIISGYNYKFLDLRDFDITDKTIGEFKPEVVYHLAARPSESTGEYSPIDMTTNSYNTFFNTLTASIRAKSLKKFIYVSSAAVYGNIRVPYNEKQSPRPNDIYAVTKFANELSLQIMANTYGFEYVIIRPHNITGERQDYRDPSRNVVVMFMQLLRLGKTPKIYGDGSSVRCYTYVKDVAKALVKCLSISNDIINVGSDKATSIQELYDEIVKVSNIHTQPDYLPPRTQEVQQNTVDHSYSRRKFDTYEETSFAETIRRTWDWLSRQPLVPFDVKRKEIDLNA